MGHCGHSVLDLNDSTSRRGGRPLHCGISTWLMSAWGLGCAKTPAVAPHVEISLSNCICGSQIILHKRRSMPCRRIVFSTFRGCMSFYTGSVILRPFD